MPAAFFCVKLQDVERLVHLLAADQVGHQPALVARQAHAAHDCFGFHGRGHPYFFAAFLSAGWPLKVRVSANSPSLWPTIWSVTYTGTCCLPLCTAIVRPMNSGRIVERRDQVLIGFLSLVAAAFSTFACR